MLINMLHCTEPKPLILVMKDSILLGFTCPTPGEHSPSGAPANFPQYSTFIPCPVHHLCRVKLLYGYIDTHNSHIHILKSNLYGGKVDQHRESESSTNNVLGLCFTKSLIIERNPHPCTVSFLPCLIPVLHPNSLRL